VTEKITSGTLQIGNCPGFRNAKIAAAASVLLSLCLGPRTSPAQDGHIDREYPIKAAYLYNFAKYVRWPENVPHDVANNGAWFTIGIVGRSPIESPLREVARKRQIQDRSIRLMAISDADNLARCHVVFVPSDHAQDFLSAMPPDAASSPVLLVGESPGFAAGGGMISFYTKDNRVKFEINPKAAEVAGLKISSKLLRLGKIVQ